MKYLIVLLLLLNSCTMLPQMQNWDTKDQILGGIFIAECIWDAKETYHLLNQKHKKEVIYNPDGTVTTNEYGHFEVNPLVKDKTSAVIYGTCGLYLVLKGADILPKIRTGWLIGFDIYEWGGAGFHAKRAIKF